LSPDDDAVKSFGQEEHLEIRDALKKDAGELAFLFNLAGEGIPEYLWEATVEGDESPLEVGARRVAREEGSFSYTNARACVENGELLGMLLSYRQPDPYETGDLSDFPEVVRPLIELEAGAPGSWYINAIATYEHQRGKGVARKLIEDAQNRARSHGCDRLSLIVASENAGAKRLYEKLDFTDVDSKPVVPYPGCSHGGDWVLMIKRIAKA
jgi:ribosomal protein S18 acetylase RimI-like enzyme